MLTAFATNSGHKTLLLKFHSFRIQYSRKWKKWRKVEQFYSQNQKRNEPLCNIDCNLQHRLCCKSKPSLIREMNLNSVQFSSYIVSQRTISAIVMHQKVWRNIVNLKPTLFNETFLKNCQFAKKLLKSSTYNCFQFYL